jgi:glycosyltransferase involved in cell wall biosynthesis
MTLAAQRLRIAFYAPLKSPDHPVPSGDRQMARMLISCLERAGHQVDVISHLRAYSPSSDDRSAWQRLQEEAKAERQRIADLWQADRPDLIFCYHSYYKSPDLIGPALSRQFALPYVTCEASYSSRRNLGVWAEMQAIARAGVQHAALNLCFSARDEAGLRAAVPDARLMRLPAFIDTSRFDAPPRPEAGHIVSVAMMRRGDKSDSYRHIAAALASMPQGTDWHLSVAGDGPARGEIMKLFALLPAKRLSWLGALPASEVAALLARGSVFLWPGCGEAYGLVYLEAQAAGLPVVCYRVAGVPEVVSDKAGGTLIAGDNPAALADAVAALLARPERAMQLGAAARARVRAGHSLEAATARLAEALRTVTDTREQP